MISISTWWKPSNNQTLHALVNNYNSDCNSPRTHKCKHEIIMASNLRLESVHDNNNALVNNLKTDNYVHMHLAILCDKISRSNYVLLRTWCFFCSFLNFHLSFKEKEKQGRVKELSMVQWINLSRYHRSVVDSRLKSLIVTKIWGNPSSACTSESYGREECGWI